MKPALTEEASAARLTCGLHRRVGLRGRAALLYVYVLGVFTCLQIDTSRLHPFLQCAGGCVCVWGGGTKD